MDTVYFNPSYGLLEFDIFFKWNLYTHGVVSAGFTHSRYSADIASFIFPGDALHAPLDIPGSSELYFKGNDISLTLEAKGLNRSRDEEINPVGRKIFLRYDYEMNRFNYNNSYEQTSSGSSPVLTPFNFHKAEVKYTEHLQLPWWKHTFSLSVHGGTIFGPEVPDYFDFYAGGLIGMRGYPFYSLAGNEMATANATYRFPVWENIDFRLLHIYFDKLYASVGYDFGNAWNGNPAVNLFKKDVGFEFRLESFSFYAYPTSIFFSGSYGLDAFSLTRNDVTVHYGKEWRYYFGVLFGFDLD